MGNICRSCRFCARCNDPGRVRNGHGSHLLPASGARSRYVAAFWGGNTTQKTGFEKVIAQLNVSFQGRLNMMAADIQPGAYLPNQYLKASAS